MLTAGTALGPYRIIAPLGKGGMGEVYRARDTRLGREVALKVVSPDFAHDPGAIRRFEQEVRAAGALNHPNVCAVMDTGTHAGSPFVVMELLEGESLRQRLKDSPVPVRKALDWAAQAADGLAAAHDKGIVHRDLKPENLFLTREGRIKVLDFGVAKLTRPEILAPAEGESITLAATQAGAILGTMGYLAPEQVRGEAADHRADLFALGAILYELLAGKRAFPGGTFAEAAISVLTQDPPPLGVPGRALPAPLEALVRRCLEKSPVERFQSARDLAFALTALNGQESPLAARPGPGGRFPFPATRQGRLAATAVALLVIGAGATALLRWRPGPGVEPPAVRAVIDLPAGEELTRFDHGPAYTEFAVSPDGRLLVFDASPDGSMGQARLFVRHLDDFQAQEVPGTEGALAPFFSPDGRWVAYWSDGKLRKWPTAGGIPAPICDCRAAPTGADWSPGGLIVVGTNSDGLFLADVARGTLTRLTTPDRTQEASHVLPRFLPGEKAVVFTVRTNLWGTNNRLEILTLDTGERKVLSEAGADARFLPTGHIVYLDHGVLMAAPFDAARLEFRSPPVPVVPDVVQALNTTNAFLNSATGLYSISTEGTLVYAAGPSTFERRIPAMWVDPSGRFEPVPNLAGNWVNGVRFSPDERYLAYGTGGRSAAVWIHDLALQTSRRVNQGEGGLGLCWTPDGQRLTFGHSAGGPPDIYVAGADGSGPRQPELLVDGDYGLIPGCWSPDGTTLIFVEDNPVTASDIWVYRADERQKTPLYNSTCAEEHPDLSPDGRWLAFSSNETGQFEVCVAELASGSRGTTVTSGGGQAPMWAPDGRTLYFWDGKCTTLMAMDITVGPRLEVGATRRLFTIPRVMRSSWARWYDLSPDGRSFVVPVPDPPTPLVITRLNLVQNWFGELERLCPSGR